MGLQQKAAESAFALKAFRQAGFPAAERELQDEQAWLKEFERDTTATQRGFAMLEAARMEVDVMLTKRLTSTTSAEELDTSKPVLQ